MAGRCVLARAALDALVPGAPEIVMAAPAFREAQALALPADSPARREAMDSNSVSAP